MKILIKKFRKYFNISFKLIQKKIINYIEKITFKSNYIFFFKFNLQIKYLL